MRRREQEPSTPSIENAFAKLMGMLCAKAERTINAFSDTVGTLIDQFSPRECANYFGAAGYETDKTGLALGAQGAPIQ
jgi:hypothetical protein